MRAIRTLGTLAAAILMTAGIADARPQYRSQNTGLNPGNWNAYQSWEILDGTWRDMTGGDPLPQAGDTVEVRANDLIKVSDAQAVMSLTVNGQLEIKDGSAGTPAKLTIGGASPALVINLTDGVVLRDQYAILEFSASVIATGSGSLEGEHNSAAIQIAPGSSGGTVTFQNSFTMHGQFTVQKKAGDSATAVFKNDSQVLADVAGGTITLASSLGSGNVLDTSGGNCSNPRWKILKPSSAAVLLFASRANGLVGDFHVAGTLTANENVTTTAKKDLISGYVINGTGVFTANGGNCP
jgi:hypothetical protein